MPVIPVIRRLKQEDHKLCRQPGVPSQPELYETQYLTQQQKSHSCQPFQSKAKKIKTMGPYEWVFWTDNLIRGFIPRN
jgi:hypothetical protein